MTRRRDAAAADDPGLRVLADCFAPVCTLVGKTWSLHLEKVTQVDPEENLRMIADSVAFLAAEGKRVVYDAEHFFDAFRDDPDYALRCLRAAADAGAENVTLCDTNGSSLPRRGGRGQRARGARARRRAGGHPHPRRRRLRRGQRAGGGGARRAHGAGHDERLRRALRQRQPGHDHPGARAEARLRGHRPRAAAAPHRDGPPGRRALQRHPEPEPALRGRQRLRPQGRHARGGREPRRAHLRARRPGRGGGRPAGADLGAGRQGHGPGAARTSTATPPRASWSASRSSSTAATSSRRPTAPSTC